jgi:hypothetical protein
MDFAQQLGRRIRRARAERGMTQSDLAHGARVGANYIPRLEATRSRTRHSGSAGSTRAGELGSCVGTAGGSSRGGAFVGVGSGATARGGRGTNGFSGEKTAVIC